MINRPEGMGRAAGSGFECGSRTRIGSAGADLECYVHRPTGARHLHLATSGEDCAFLMAFRTPAPDSSGLTHVLEHLVMCGSERYPCRRTFFAMLGRTLGTAMNALTREDCTAYHFVTRNLVDYDNLLSVYLDAAFFPRLERADFHHEGSHVEFEETGEGNPVPVRRGVVLSEMRGAMGDPEAQLQQALNRALFPGSAYRFNAGGDPWRIPSLEYEALLRYHRRHYHPGNAVFLSAGNLEARWLQERLQERGLARFPERIVPPAPVEVSPLTAPSRSVVCYPAAGAAPDDRSGTGVALAWRLGESADPQAAARARLLSRCLLEQGEAPVRLALEAPGTLGAALSSNGVRETRSRLVLQCGALGCDPRDANDLEARVLAGVERASRAGFADAEVDAACAALERELREQHDRRYPSPLKHLVRLLPAALYGGEPAAALDAAATLANLRDQLRSRRDTAELVRRDLADNPERVCVTAIPDPAVARRLENEDRALLQRTFPSPRRAALSDVTGMAAPAPDRRSRAGESSLPMLGLDAIGSERPRAPFAAHSRGNPEVWISRGVTGGLVYARLAVDADGIGSHCLEDLGLLAEILPESGHGGRGAARTRAHLARVCDRISAEPWLLARGGRCPGAPDAASHTVFMLSARARAADEAELIDALADAHLEVRFDSGTRDIAARAALRSKAILGRDGHLHAERVAASQLGPWNALAEHWRGPSAVKALTSALEGDAGGEVLERRLHRVHRALAAAPCRLQIVCEDGDRSASDPRRAWRDHSAPESPAPPGRKYGPRHAPPPAAWVLGGTVNYCAKAYPAVGADHPDAAPLGVLAALLGGDLLARAIREEGGAYGAGARYCERSATLRMFSYRDPRLAETLGDFDRASESLRHRPPTRGRLEEAILRAVRELDRPRAFQVAAFERYLDELQGRDPQGVRRQRDAMLRTSAAAVRETARRYLRPERGRVGVLAAAGREAELDRLGIEWSRV